MSQSPNDEQAAITPDWLRARRDLSQMIKQGRSFSGHERNCCFLNTGREHFATISAVSGLDFPDDGRGIAIVDWDHDGDLDVWLTNRNAPRIRFMRNDTATINHYVSFRLIGNGTTTNRDAIGARVEVILEPNETRRLVKTLRAGEGFLSQTSKWIHFGLGDTNQIEKAIVHWPGGGTEEYTGLEVNRRYQLQQSMGSASPLSASPRLLALHPSTLDLPPPSRAARIPLVAPLHVPEFSYTTLDKASRRAGLGAGHPVLLNLWASWCSPCVKELSEFARRKDELRAAGISIVALAVDEFDDDSFDVAPIRDTLSQVGFPFLAGLADQYLVRDLQDYHNHVVSLWRPLPIPASFLIDGDSRLVSIYKGPVTVDQVLADARHAPGGYVQQLERAACLPGRAVDHPQVAESAREAEIRTRFRVAAGWNAADRLTEATASFLDLLRFYPECEEAHGQLAIIYLRRQDLTKAAEHCRRVLELDPKNPRHHNTMGNILSGQQKLSLAESHYLRAIQYDPKYAQAHNNLGTIYASQGKFSAAASQFKQAIDIDPDSAEAHNNLGSVYAYLGDLSKASTHYRTAIRADPTYAEAYNNLGSAFARLGDLEQAVTQYQRALEINPTYAEARANLERAQLSLRGR